MSVIGNTTMKIWGVILMIVGSTICVFSNKIVFPGLEVVLGIERIVGKDSVVYLDGGGYIYTNPGAMVRWIAGVVLVGVVIFGFGAVMCFRGKRSRGVNPCPNADAG